MTTPTFIVTFEAQQGEPLSKLTALIIPGLTLLSIKPADETQRKTMRYAGGVRNKGITAEKLLEETFAEDKVVTKKNLISIFKTRGFAEASYAPALSAAVRDGKIVKVGDEQWARKGATLRK